ncbi:MAG: DMT family transporter [Methanosarcinaceae archaeon]|nr:DMT family transporter [Methanosarcinaceae archaeon]
MEKSTVIPHLEVVVGCVLSGTMGIFLNLIQDMSAVSILSWRMLFGFCILLLYLILARDLGKVRLGKKKRYLLLLGFLNSVTGFCFFSAIKYCGISVALLLLYTAPVYVSLLAPLLLKENRNDKSLPGLVLAIAGVVLIAQPGNILNNLGTSNSHFLGLAFGLLSGFAFSGIFLTSRYLKDAYNGTSQTFWITAVGMLLTFPAALSTPLPLLAQNMHLLFFLALVVTLASVLYLKGIPKVGAQKGSILALSEPVAGIFFAYIILKEPVFLSTILGCCFIIGAALLVSVKLSFRLAKRPLVEVCDEIGTDPDYP